jgi:hypothetical protein
MQAAGQIEHVQSLPLAGNLIFLRQANYKRRSANNVLDSRDILVERGQLRSRCVVSAVLLRSIALPGPLVIDAFGRSRSA